MNLDDAQRKTVAGWIADGLKLSEIQNRLSTELGIRMTYMDVRLLVDDLKLTPKDPEAPAPPPQPAKAPEAVPAEEANLANPAPAPTDPLAGTGKVAVSVDKIARPGALVSGKVTFSDGNQAEWHLDQTGRLGLIPQKQGYRPSPPDVEQFRAGLEAELAKLGF